MSYREELDMLHAQAATRRAAGQPCNPHRDGLTNVDWLSLDELDRAHVLGLQGAVAEMLAATCWESA